MSPTLIGITVCIVLGIVVNVPWGTVGAWFTKTPEAPPADDDAADVAALKRLQARFKRLNCPEGTAAMGVVGTHFFHEGA